MPTIEVPEEFAEQIADWAGVYGGGPADGSDHPDDCKCRMCFTEMVTKRIYKSVTNAILMGSGGVK